LAKRLKTKKKKTTGNGRIVVLAVVFAMLSAVLICRLYRLQIIEGENYRNNFIIRTTKTRTINSTRGNIFDRYGNLLAYNELSYSLTIEDSGTYPTKRERALSLNEEAYRIYTILKKYDNDISQTFHVEVNDQDMYQYDVEGRSLDRFRADVYGYAYIDDLKETEKNADAETMMEYLISEKGYSIVNTKDPYTDKEYEAHPYLPKELTKEEMLAIVKIRYALFTTSFQKYLPVTIAKELSDELMAELTENKDTLTGINIVEDTKRVYTDAEYFAPLIGYTGTISSEELAELQQENPEYSNSSIVGKAGVEKVMETTLQGSNGSEKVSVDNVGRVLAIDEEGRRDPVAGNDVYLTIDPYLQKAVYKILEQRIAGIVASNIIDARTVEENESDDTELIKIPSYEVYFALINNSIIDFHHFTEIDSSDVEREVAREFTVKQREIFDEITRQLTTENPTVYSDLSKEMKEYQSYIVNDLLLDKTGILDSTALDRTDEVYLAWSRDERISLQEFLTYAASQNWINIAEIAPEDNYIDSTQIYQELSEYIINYLSTDDSFSKILYKHLIYNDRVSGKQVMQIMYEQGVLDKEDGVYDAFMRGRLSTFDTLMEKIMDLDITPAMLALDPCSGSAVVINPQNGELLALVTYPGYDNNRLANQMDVAYYRQLASDLSRPFYNKATQARTAPGSTFKLVTTAAGMSEGVVGRDTEFDCQGIFDLTETPLRCWYHSGHGRLNLPEAIENSCNVYFCNVSYNMGLNEEGLWSDSLALSKLQSYAAMFDLDKQTGIEIPEAAPKVSDLSAIQSSIGQGTHAYTTTQIARYAATLANGGTSYRLTLFDKVTDSKGNLIRDYSPEIESRLALSEDTWNVIHTGMEKVVAAKKEYADMPITVAGKTGTAQESKSRPSHALFICYAPAEEPEIAMCVRISNGYSSTNCIITAKDILQYYFDIVDDEEILTGKAMTNNISSVSVD